MSILNKFNFFTKDFFSEVLPSIEIPNAIIAILFSALCYIPFDLIINSKSVQDVNDTIYRMDTCLNAVSQKITDKCVQGIYLNSLVGVEVKFVMFIKKNGQEVIESSYLLTNAIREDIRNLYNNAEKHHVKEMMKTENCPNTEKKERKLCEVFSGYQVIREPLISYISLYNKENVEKYARDLSFYLSNTF